MKSANTIRWELAGIALAAFFLLGIPIGRAQTTVVRPVIISGGVPIGNVFEDAVEVTEAVDAGGQNAKKASEEESERLKKFKELKFDRRPSTIFKVWLEEKEEKKKEQTEKEQTKKEQPAEGGQEDVATAEDKKAASTQEAPAAEDSPADETESDGTLSKAKEKAEEKKAADFETSEEDETPATDDKAANAEKKVNPAEAEADAEAEKKKEQQQKEEAARKKAESEKIAKELKALERDVTLGRWDKVKEYLGNFKDEEGKVAYKHLLSSLSAGNPGADPQMQQAMQSLPPMMQELAQQVDQLQENNVFDFEDVLSLASAQPGEHDKESLQRLSAIVRLALAQGHTIDALVEMLRGQGNDDHPALGKRDVARLLAGIGHGDKMGEFLPSVEEAQKSDDREALNLLAQHFLALNGKEHDKKHLVAAWKATLAALAVGKIEEEEKNTALTRAVDLATQVRDELGEAWLKESFTSESERGAEILSSIGHAVAQNVRNHPTDPARRLKNLELQNKAVESLLAVTGDNLEPWQRVLNLLAENWLREAEISLKYSAVSSRGPNMQYDVYGNVYFVNQSQRYNQQLSGRQKIRPIGADKMVDLLPSETWQHALAASIKPKFTSQCARLFLKVNEENKAFPYIEQLAAVFPSQAHELAEEFVRTWTRNHDLNSKNQNYGSYFYIYGFQPRAESIPLTRSKQERNLEELSSWVKKLKALPIEPVKEDLLADAFTKSHSSAEVYRIEALERVFGSVDAMDPDTLGAMAEGMCSNLAGIWRDPAVQQQNKTKRKKKDLEAEVLRGYEVAKQVVDRGLTSHPDHWRLTLAKACLLHDENNYRRELDPDYSFAPTRRTALETFRQAAGQYANHVSTLDEKDYTTEVYDRWFYAALGASQLQSIDESNRLAESQPPLIRQALLDLPEIAREPHLDRFANNLFRRMSGAKPQVKYRYLKAGLHIVGEHPQAREARKVFDYYADLVTEIKFDTVIDGTDVVGHEEPFGVFINLRHTKEIERESGGFGRYLQNQNNMYYAYNYGRPTADYLDKFEEGVHAALDEQFEVLSLTFQKDDVQSKAVQPYGWRVTPYAYLLLKARGPEVDRLPPLKLDLDFLDTSGYVVLPIESPALPIDASGEQLARPVENVKVTQVLDERQADDGKLILEVKATANGLVPPIDELLELKVPGFKVANIEKQPVAVSRFDPDQDQTVIVSERIWSIELAASDGRAPEKFEFPASRENASVAEVLYQRYDDADLVQVDRTFNLQEQYGSESLPAWALPAGLLAIVAAVLLVAGKQFLKRPANERAKAAFVMPGQITPFTVLSLLKQIDQRNGLDDAGRQRLRGDIQHIETHYFAGTNGSEQPDLQMVATSWLNEAAHRTELRVGHERHPDGDKK